MKIIYFIALLVLFSSLFVAVYILLDNLPGEIEEFQDYNIDLADGLSTKSTQFYPYMRYPDKVIGYTLDKNCSSKKGEDFERATEILEQRTMLEFYRTENGELVVSCSNIAPTAEQRNHFVAG